MAVNRSGISIIPYIRERSSARSDIIDRRRCLLFLLNQIVPLLLLSLPRYHMAARRNAALFQLRQDLRLWLAVVD